MEPATAARHVSDPEDDPRAIARQQLRNVADAFGISDDLVAILGECKKAVEVTIPTTMDDGSVHAFTGYRVPTTSRAAPPRAASAITRASHSTPSRRLRCG